MSFHQYQRVIPRDLFNEANLLKCLGQVYLELEKLNCPNVELYFNSSGPFNIQQDDSSGALTVRNVGLKVRGFSYDFQRPLNSRRPYPLYMEGLGAHDIEVFNDDGTFTNEMKRFLIGEADDESATRSTSGPHEEPHG